MIIIIRFDLKQSHSIEIIVLKNNRIVVVPQSWQIPSCLQNYVDWEQETQDNTGDNNLYVVPQSE